MGTKSNWLLIKLVKLLAEMCKAEERLLPKLVAKFIEILSKPKAKSVEVELLKNVEVELHRIVALKLKEIKAVGLKKLRAL